MTRPALSRTVSPLRLPFQTEAKSIETSFEESSRCSAGSQKSLKMSEPSSVAAGRAAMAASSTDPIAAAVAGDEHTADGSVSGLSSSKAASFTQIQQKYSEEAAKRRRDDGLSQYVDLSRSDKFRHYQDDPWLDANALEVGVPALTQGDTCKYLILGAGFGGLVFAVRLIQAGISVDDIRIVDSAGGFGGTW